VRAPLVIGARLAGAEDRACEDSRAFARLALASVVFSFADDLLGTFGDPAFDRQAFAPAICVKASARHSSPSSPTKRAATHSSRRCVEPAAHEGSHDDVVEALGRLSRLFWSSGEGRGAAIEALLERAKQALAAPIPSPKAARRPSARSAVLTLGHRER